MRENDPLTVRRIALLALFLAVRTSLSLISLRVTGDSLIYAELIWVYGVSLRYFNFQIVHLFIQIRQSKKNKCTKQPKINARDDD